MFKVNSEKDLLRLLRIVSQEAVGVTKRTLRENRDPYLEKYSTDFDEDQAVFGKLRKLSEQEEEEDEAEAEEPAEEEAEEPVDDEAEEPAEEEPAEEEPAEEEAEESETSQAFGASFDSVLTAINNLRAGRSLKDDAIKNATSSYYDSLSDEEREVLLLFLKSLSTILSGGEETHDPSEDPYNYVISKGSEESDEADADAEAEAEEEPIEDEGDEEPVEDEEEAEEPVDDEGEEDTSPPIKVNESQDFTQIRKKVRRLMLKG